MGPGGVQWWKKRYPGGCGHQDAERDHRNWADCEIKDLGSRRADDSPVRLARCACTFRFDLRSCQELFGATH